MHLINQFFSTENSLCYENYFRIYRDDLQRLHGDSCNPRTKPPLYYASQTGLVDNVSILIQRNVDLNGQYAYAYDGVVTALHIATVRGHVHIVELLLKAGAEVDLYIAGYFTPLQRACIYGYHVVVSHLLKAVRDGHIATMELLLHAGADPNIGGGGPLWYARHSRQPTKDRMIEMLLEAGARDEVYAPLDPRAVAPADEGDEDNDSSQSGGSQNDYEVDDDDSDFPQSEGNQNDSEIDVGDGNSDRPPSKSS